MEEKRQIAPTLKAMEVGQSEKFPLSQLRSVISTASLMRLTHNMRFRTKCNYIGDGIGEKTVTIWRVS